MQKVFLFMGNYGRFDLSTTGFERFGVSSLKGIFIASNRFQPDIDSLVVPGIDLDQSKQENAITRENSDWFMRTPGGKELFYLSESWFVWSR